jgi:hypothetical protein
MSVAKRSSVPKVLGILNLVGGFLGLLFSLFGVLALVLGPGGFGPQTADNPLDPVVMDTYMVANAPGYHVYQYVNLGIGLVLDLLLIVSGFGLLYYRKWARRMAITYAVTSLSYKFGFLSYNLAVFIPTMSSFYDQALGSGVPGLPGVSAGVLKASLYFGLCFWLAFAVYPIVVLSLLLSKSGKAAFGPLVLREADDDEDDYDDRRERFDRDRPRRDDDDRYSERDDRGGR